MTFVKLMESAGTSPLLIDGGDFLFALKDYQANAFQRKQVKEKARLIVESYNRFGYDAVAVGECDLALGLQTLRELEQEMKFPLLCANLVQGEEQKPVFAGSHVLEHQGLRFGVVAVLSDKLSPTFVQRTVPGGKVLPPLPAARQEIAKIQDDVDAIIVLAHVDKPQVFEIMDTIPGVDLVLEPNSFMGNAVIWLTEGQHFEEHNGSLVVRSEGQGSHISRVDLRLRKKGARWVGEDADDGEGNVYRAKDYALGPQYGSHKTIQAMTEQFRKNTKFMKVEDPPTFEPSKDYLTAQTCQACHAEQYAFWKQTGHAKAYETLEKTGDQFRLDCLPCHVVGYGETFMDPTQVGAFKDVQCENCHGTNPQHPTDPVRFGWPKVDVSGCWGCHHPRETRVPFEPYEALRKVQCPPLRRN